MEIPSAADDRPRFARVGIVAAVGFVIGIAWPGLAGVHLAPSAPADELARPAPSAEAAPSASAAAAPPVADATSDDDAPPAAARAPAKRISVGKANITSCRTKDGKTLPACDPIPVDAVFIPHLEALEGCSGLDDAHGVLSLGLKLDFEQGKVRDVIQGKSTTITDRAARALLGCVERELQSVAFASMVHAQSEYTVFYLLELAPAAEAGDDARAHDAEGGDVAPASGMATVAWVAARVRKEPEKGSDELGRLLSGTRVKVLGRRGEWYKIQYNSKGEEGWVFKSAIGL